MRRVSGSELTLVTALLLVSQVGFLSCDGSPDRHSARTSHTTDETRIQDPCEGHFQLFSDLEEDFRCDTGNAVTVADKAKVLYDRLQGREWNKCGAPDDCDDPKKLEVLWIADAVWYRDQAEFQPLFAVSDAALVQVPNMPFGLPMPPKDSDVPPFQFDLNETPRHLDLLGVYTDRTDPTERGNPVVVAVLDSGVIADHRLLSASRRRTDSPEHGWHDGLWDNPEWYVDNSARAHGTAVASLISGHFVHDDGRIETTGSAPMSRWIACRAWRGTRARCDGTSRSLLSCLQWALAPGGAPEMAPHIVNISGVFNGDAGRLMIRRAIQVLECAGIVVVAAAGNLTLNNRCTVIRYPPQTLDSVITVGALSSPTELRDDSKKGPTPDYPDGARIKPDVVAPGWAMWVAGRENVSSRPTLSQTSAAAPLISGLVARWLDECNGMRSQPADVRKQLRCTANRLYRNSETDCLCEKCQPNQCENFDTRQPPVNSAFGYGYPSFDRVKKLCPITASPE